MVGGEHCDAADGISADAAVELQPVQHRRHEKSGAAVCEPRFSWSGGDRGSEPLVQHGCVYRAARGERIFWKCGTGCISRAGARDLGFVGVEAVAVYGTIWIAVPGRDF